MGWDWGLIKVRKCLGCQIELTKDNAYRHRQGLRSRCKACYDKQVKAWKAANPKSVQRYATNYQKANPEVARAWNNKATARWKVNNPAKRKASAKITNAIRDGRLSRGNCEVCAKLYQKEVLGQAHHPDYNFPTQVTWLCHLHHRAWHRVFLAEQKAASW